MRCAKQTWLGAYLLDALEPGETEDVSSHIAGCSICQDEVVRLAWIPGLLRTIALEDIERLDDYSIPDGRPPRSPALDQPQTASRGKSTTPRWRRSVAVLAGLAAAATMAGAAGKILCSSRDCLAIWTPLTLAKGQQPTGPSGVAQHCVPP
jgi:anti-sigma factor RsiW